MKPTHSASTGVFDAVIILRNGCNIGYYKIMCAAWLEMCVIGLCRNASDA